MKKLFAIVALTAFFASSAAAQDPATVQTLDGFSAAFTLESPECTVNIDLFSPEPAFCWGAYGGNPQQAATQSIITDWLTTEFGGASVAGQANGTESAGIMTGFNGDPSGTVDFNTALSGRYVLALKGSTTFSLFYFDLVSPVSSIGFVMDGSATNPQDGPQALSNASIWSLETVSVPEPVSGWP